MKKVHFVETKPINRRANAKGVTLKGRHYLIGGLSPAGTETDIVEMHIDQSSTNELNVKWIPVSIPNLKSVFTQRNSFPACASDSRIFIYGGQEITADGTRSLGDLIEIDPEAKTIRKVVTKGENPPDMNSSTMVYNPLDDSLVLFGGATDSGAVNDAYTFQIKSSEWKKHSVEAPIYKEGIWMHSCHFSEQFFNTVEELNKSNALYGHKVIGLDLGVGEAGEEVMKEIKKVRIGEEPFETQPCREQPIQPQPILKKQPPKGPFLIIIGGCNNPTEPYPYLSQMSLQSFEVVSHINVNPVVAHESNIYKGQIFIVGGSDGVGLVDNITVVGEKVRSQKGIVGIGAASFVTERGVVVYGGINVQSSSFNGWALLG